MAKTNLSVLPLAFRAERHCIHLSGSSRLKKRNRSLRLLCVFLVWSMGLVQSMTFDCEEGGVPEVVTLLVE